MVATEPAVDLELTASCVLSALPRYVFVVGSPFEHRCAAHINRDISLEAPPKKVLSLRYV